MLTEISGILASLNAARQIGSALVDLHEREAVREKVSELRDMISDAQDGLYRVGQERSEMADKVRELEAKIALMDDWKERSEPFHLVQYSGTQTYIRKRTEDGSAPMCANCFENRKIAVLQSETRVPGMAHVLVCNECGSELYVRGVRHKEHGHAPHR